MIWSGLRVLVVSVLLTMVGRAAEPNILTALMVGVMGDDGADKFFYYPTKDQPITPADRGLKYADVFFSTEDGVKLHGWWMPAAQSRVKGSIVYSHGNAGSVAYHLPFVSWLVKAGYNVLLYDYRGFGKSEGEVSKPGLVVDAKAAIHYAGSRADCGALISFGHSLGGAKSIAAIGENAPKELKAVIVDSTFASYRDVAASVMGERARKVVSGSFEPAEYVKKILGVPLLVVHGTADRTIPHSQAEKLYAAARQPKAMMTIQGANHVNCFFIEGKKYQGRLLSWLDGVLASKK